MPKRLHELENEQAEAQKWLAKNPGLGSMPDPDSRDAETGESIGKERSGFWSGSDRAQMGVNEDNPARPHLRLDDVVNLADREADYSEGGRFIPLIGQGQPVDVRSADMAKRVRLVLDLMDEAQAELLWQRGVLQRTLADIAQEYGVRYQTVQSLYSTAKANFEQLFAEHAEDDITLSAEDL